MIDYKKKIQMSEKTKIRIILPNGIKSLVNNDQFSTIQNLGDSVAELKR